MKILKHKNSIVVGKTTRKDSCGSEVILNNIGIGKNNFSYLSNLVETSTSTTGNELANFDNGKVINKKN